ncbi:MAG TPA: MBL fold metallo-hydrolase [Candidatus Binatia bacterium]|nr:MBL fold metallo-hydrolase [Candidatus Binatia bacterium]
MRTLLASDDEAVLRKPGVAGRGSVARLKFYGVRGSVPTPGRATVRYGGNTSCVEIRANGQIIILDAGTGLRLLGRDLLAEFGQQPLNLTLLLTHTHWDHIQGLPYFLPVYQPQNQLRILGPEGARTSLEHVLSSQMESPYFPIGLRQVPANICIEVFKDLSFPLGSVQVQAFFAYHPGICVGYRLSMAGRSIAFFPDNELRQASERPRASKGKRAPQEFAPGENQKLAEFLRGTDVLIMDAQYDRAEYEQHIGWGHGCLDDVVALALEADVKRLFLFHHDPDHTDAKVSQMVSDARRQVATRKGKLQVEAAREGHCVELAAVRKVTGARQI